jgi:predicted  nucleic acid-binding Zn-ribbon protein
MKMSKAIAIPIICILVVAFLVTGYFLWSQTGKLGDARDEIVDLEDYSATMEGDIDDLEGEVSGLEGNVADLEGEVADLGENVEGLEDDLAESEATVATLTDNLANANSEISELEDDVLALEGTNTSLSAELNTMKDPRHFTSITELADWLQKDDTDTRYRTRTNAEKALILQVRALRDGYIISAFVVPNGEGIGLVVIGDEYWAINPEDDDVEFVAYVDPLPSHPLPL